MGRSDIKSLSKEQAEVHQYHLAQADKLIAHSVNGFEMVYAGLSVNDTKVGVGFLAARLVGLDKPDSERWLDLITFLSERVILPKVQEAFNAALARAQTIPHEDVLRAKVIQGGNPTRAGAAKKRS